MNVLTTKGAYRMPNKTSNAKLRANEQYSKDNITRINVNLNRNTMQDVIDALELCDSKQGFIVSLIRSDCYRRFSNHLLLNGNDLTYQTVSKYAADIEAAFPRFRELADQDALARVESLFVEDTPAHVIVAEYLRSTATDPIIID